MKKQPYVVQKTVWATSITDALKREKGSAVTNVYLDVPPRPEELPPAIGFHLFTDPESEMLE